MIALRTQPFYIEKYEMDTNFNTLSDYLRTLSQILQHIPNISQYHINVVIELSILFIKKFPNTNRKNRDYIVNALKSTFLNIICLEKNVQSQYFKCFFREGILNSCSHRLFIDVELQQQMQSLPEYPICYKNYLPLWQSLFKIESENQFPRHFILQIFNEFISVLILFVDNLNFNVNFQDDNLYSDTFSLLKVENKTDFRFFINLVDLYIDVFENVNSILLKNWIEKLIIYFIKYSYKYSLISGFYKLIKISQYICNVIKLIPGFSGELQVSCIYLIFSIPLHFIKDLMSQISSVFKIAFNIGLNDLSLAFYALKMLENLINNPEIQCSRDFVMSAIHYIDPYLSCEYGSLNISAFTIKDKKESLQNITNMNDDESLEQLQKKILLFYGSLGLNILLDFIHEKSIQTNATWNKKNLFQHELLFPDIRLVIYFDKFIPRIIELTKSVNNKTKISACELLHTLIIVIVEKKLMDQCFNKPMCYTVLRLASDSNDTIRNLYYPLVIQLTHYLSSNLMKESRIPQDFIDSLFEGLTEEFNTCIRDCCGLYLKEFVEWSVKQSNESEFASLLKMRNIVHRITNSALYPSNKKHLAAAIAFNHLFSILQENSSILNIYWLEFLYAFVKCLEDSDDIQIICAINRIEKVIRNNATIFNIESSDRRRPPGFPDVTLKGVLIWLFNYCASLNIKCRCKSRELFEHFLPLTSEYDVIKSVLMDKVNEIVLKNLEEDFEYITINNSKAMLRSLDFYIWILKRKFLPLESLTVIEKLPEKLKILLTLIKTVSLKKKPIEAIRKNGSPNALYSWILEELFTSNNLEKKTIFLQHFLICLVDEESTIINPELFIVFRQLRDEDTSVCLKKFESDDTLRFQAISCFQMLLKMLVITKSLTLYQGLIKYTAGMYNFLFKENIKEYLNLYFANLSDVNALKSLEIAYKMFMEFNLSVERLDVLKYFLLPSIESNKTSIIERFYVENYKEIISYVIRKISDVLSSTEDRIKLIISKIGSYNIFELLFAKFELKFMTVVDSTTHIEKSINQILVRQAMDLRSLITKNAEEKEMTRLLHCAGFNCCTTLISMKKDEVFYPLIFYEDKKTNALIWERIVDCDRKYNFNETTSSVKKDIKTLINIRRNNYNNEENPRETADSYYHHYSLASLTYFEDVHAFDLNDYKILTQVETNVEVERRLSMSFESDELNEHECMPMISGVLVHMFNNEIYAMPEGQIGTDQLPRCLKYFRNSFATRHDNVRLFLMKIIGNAKNAFVPCIKAFFQPLLGTIDRYLASNPLNYIVRDILVILIQSRYKPIGEGEIKDAQKLIERLIEVAPDHSPRFFRYNLDLIENLTRLWIEQLHWPKILENKVNLDCDLLVKASLALLHAGLRGITDCGLICNHVWSAMQHWTEEESKVLARFEALGWIMRLRDKNCSHIGTPEITALLSNIEAKNQDRWARCLFALHRGWGLQAQSGPTLIELKRLPEHAWPEALDLFLRRLPHLQPDRLHTEFLLLDLSMYLRERSPTCAGPALRILAALVPRLAEPELRPLLLLAVRLTGPAGTPEQRWLGYAALAEAYLHYKDAFYLRWLVRGLNDPSEKVHEEVLEFWRNRISMPKTSSERLLFILDLYMPELESVFAHFLCLSMLDLAANAQDGERLLLDILDNNVPTSWKFASLGTHAPLFVPSLVSRLNMPGSWLDADQSVPKRMPDPSQNELSWRPNSRELSAASKRHGSYRRRFVTDDYEKSNVTQQGFVESVKRLLAQDTMFCKDFAVALVCQLIERLRGAEKYDDFVNNLTASFDRALQAQQEEDSDFLAVILEIALRSKVMRVNAETIGKVCKTPSLNALGILLLEQNINEESEEDPPPKKRAKTDDLEEKGNWMKLATLFKSIGKGDLVKSIFKRPNVFIKEMREAAMAHANTEWLEAKDLYEIAYEVTFSPEKDFCLENMFECFYELSSWGEITKKTDIILDGNYNSVWESPKRQLLLPWILRGQLQQSLEVFNDGKELENANFIANFDSWIQSKESFMKKTYGEEMAMFYICGQETDEISRHSVKCHLDYLREQWTRLSPLSEILKTQILMKLRAIYNINNYIELLRSTDIVEASKSIIRYWDQHVPSPNDELSIWNIHVSYRLTLANILHRKLFENGAESMAFKEIIAASIRQRLKITELAMKHKNYVIAKKHVLRCEIMLNQLDGNDYLKLKHDFTLTASKYKFFCGQRFTNTAKKFKYYLCSWQITDQIIKDNNADLVTKINAKHHLFDLALALKSSAEKNPEFLHLLMQTNIFKEMDKPDGANILDAFKAYSFNILKNVCESSNDTVMAKSYTKFGKYCYTFLYGIYQRDSTISDQFISSILIGMSLGSLEAAHYFPCLLKEEFYENEQSVQLFISKSKNVPSWMFLSWQAQILAYLNKPIAKLLIPILYRLVSDYPYGIMYNFRHIYEALPSLRINCKIQSMYESLFSNPKIDTFFKAMHRVCQPEHYTRHYLLKIFESDGNLSNSIDTLIDNIFIQQVQDNSLQGLIYRVLDKYKRRLNEVKEMDCENAKKHLRNIAIDLYESMKKRLANVNRQALQIKDYSPYLSNFSGEDIELEIPGQYRDNVKPMPHYHIKILKFHRFVRVMDSKCNPIKIRMIGNDALTYDFLTKFGEDLRLDQRLQQIFNITNKTLKADINCKKRHLSINTYNVIALSSSLGLIQWVDETKSLKEFVQFSMADKTIIETVSLKYQSWIKKAGRSDGLSSAYKRAVTKYHPKEVISKMKELINVINPDCLRKTFVMLSPSLECFVSLRQNFITSYATMCTIHWITGVGDRHLENLLIEVKSGKCYGIDFGLAFGTGIDQSIPELVPFRLTAQILGLFKPFTEEDLFGITMTHVLNALRIEQGPMVACLDIFIQEPLDWSKHANKHLNDEQEKDFKWLPRKKIEIIEKKLNGGNPSKIMVEELSIMHDDENLFEGTLYKYTHIINGTDSKHIRKRSRMKTEFLTSEKQVQCLVEQATDLNILGRMWVGWAPYV
ncbi:PREDICTED: DNA-dependent protein kinase catalytic subunit-like [Ceratosolen solmsi marchali]|uniref:DNA-dependent protein kinase catalytic subunit-like n=1 Tax=Ceratosolen solmsi marchali TaxID=326594 RepID=A0AAJ7E0M0_9HYME|nr:PREDICTED: DNA-dependent protein kinase catalytic subunit-like [Ceratosolen solmsi marchali]